MKKDKLLAVLFCISIFVLLYAEYLFESIFIPFYIPLIFWIFVLIFSIPLIKRNHTSNISSFYKIMIVGNSCLFLFILINFYCVIGNEYDKKVKILSSSSIVSGNGKGQFNKPEPIAEIQLNGQLKSITFSSEVDIQSKKYVSLILKNNIFGFPVILQRNSY